MGELTTAPPDNILLQLNFRLRFQKSMKKQLSEAIVTGDSILTNQLLDEIEKIGFNNIDNFTTYDDSNMLVDERICKVDEKIYITRPSNQYHLQAVAFFRGSFSAGHYVTISFHDGEYYLFNDSQKSV